MPTLEKSDIMENVLNTILSISSRKTSLGYAVTTMDSSIKQLENQFDFLRHVEIKDTRYSEEDDSISVMSDINVVESQKFTQAIHAIIRTMDKSLGRNAGHFFIKEIQSALDDDHKTVMREIGIDFGLLQLERDVEEWERLTLEK